MRFFDEDRVGCLLDTIVHTIDENDETGSKRVVLTLRVHPLTPDLAVALDAEVRSLLFTMHTAEPKRKLKAVDLALTIPNQRIRVYALPEIPDASIAFTDVKIAHVKAKLRDDEWALTFTADVGMLGAAELEYVCRWHDEQRFLTFEAQQAALDFEPTAPARRSRSPRAPGPALDALTEAYGTPATEG